MTETAVGKAMLTTMFDYNAVTNARLLACAERVGAAELDTPADMGRGSLRETLYHLLTVEWAWGHVVRDHHGPTAPPAIELSSPFAEWETFAADNARQMRAFLDTLTDDDLAESVTVERFDTKYQMIVWRMLVHMLYHAAQHRAEVAALLTRYGQSPGDTDFLFFAG